MNIRTLICTFVGFLSFFSLNIYAQSVDYAHNLIRQGKYREAAMQLRPLADNGDAEAQYIAAQLFFEGKGVVKNNEQGVKYATLAANQSHEKAIVLLATHYYETRDYQKMFITLNNAVSRHPYMEIKAPGAALAMCYMNGLGTMQNTQKAQQLLSNNPQWMGQLTEAAPTLISNLPPLVSDMRVTRFYGVTQQEQHSSIYADDNTVGVDFTFNSNQPHNRPLQFSIQKDGTHIVDWNQTVKVTEGYNSLFTQIYVGSLSEGYYSFIISEAGDGVQYVNAPFQVFSTARREQDEWEKLQAQVQVHTRQGSLIQPRYGGAKWKNGTLEVSIIVNTRMVRRQVSVKRTFARDGYNNIIPSNKHKVRVAGLPQQSGYYILTNNDTACFTVCIPDMPPAGKLSELELTLSLSGTEEFIHLENVAWR